MPRRLFTLIILSAVYLSAFADVVAPGEIKKQFMITNLDQYPGFTYYFLHFGFHYHRGWIAEPPDTTQVNNNTPYTVSTRGNNRTFLYGLPMVNSNNRYYNSDLEMGGSVMTDPSVTNITEVYEITGMENAVIKLKKIKEIILYNNAKVEERKAGAGWMMAPPNNDLNIGLSGLAAGALLVLLLVFYVKKHNRYFNPVSG